MPKQFDRLPNGENGEGQMKAAVRPIWLSPRRWNRIVKQNLESFWRNGKFETNQ